MIWLDLSINVQESRCIAALGWLYSWEKQDIKYCKWINKHMESVHQFVGLKWHFKFMSLWWCSGAWTRSNSLSDLLRPSVGGWNLRKFRLRRSHHSPEFPEFGESGDTSEPISYPFHIKVPDLLHPQSSAVREVTTLTCWTVELLASTFSGLPSLAVSGYLSRHRLEHWHQGWFTLWEFLSMGEIWESDCLSTILKFNSKCTDMLGWVKVPFSQFAKKLDMPTTLIKHLLQSTDALVPPAILLWGMDTRSSSNLAQVKFI